MDLFYSDNPKYDNPNAKLEWNDSADGSILILHYEGHQFECFLSDDELISSCIDIQDDIELSKHILSLVCEHTEFNVDDVYNAIIKNNPRFC